MKYSNTRIINNLWAIQEPENSYFKEKMWKHITNPSTAYPWSRLTKKKWLWMISRVRCLLWWTRLVIPRRIANIYRISKKYMTLDSRPLYCCFQRTLSKMSPTHMLILRQPTIIWLVGIFLWFLASPRVF